MIKKTTIKFCLLFISINLFSFSVSNVYAQCQNFAKSICKPKLGEFLHDGNFNSTVLGTGETAELYKTFFSGNTYRIAIAKVDNLPVIHFRVVDDNNNILFDNKEHDYTDVWDFSVETTQMLVVKIKVLDDYQNTDKNKITKGCVSVLFGIKK